MDQLQNTAVSPDRVDRCNLFGYRIITAAVINLLIFFSHPIYCDARTALALPVV